MQMCSGKHNGAQLPSTLDCAVYFVCDHGMPEEMRCSDNLLYDEKLNVCNWAENVPCGQLQKVCVIFAISLTRVRCLIEITNMTATSNIGIARTTSPTRFAWHCRTPSRVGMDASPTKAIGTDHPARTVQRTIARSHKATNRRSARVPAR